MIILAKAFLRATTGEEKEENLTSRFESREFAREALRGNKKIVQNGKEEEKVFFLQKYFCEAQKISRLNHKFFPLAELGFLNENIFYINGVEFTTINFGRFAGIFLESSSRLFFDFIYVNA